LAAGVAFALVLALSLVLALALSLAVAANNALAARAKCTVTSVNADSITLDCGTKTKSFKIGDEVKIRTAKKQRAIEGC
jgi:hypothetical protein